MTVERLRLPGGVELWAKDRIVALMPAIEPDMPAGLAAAIERRAMASLSGRCECGGVVETGQPIAPRMGHVALVHENDCPASDAYVGPMLQAYYQRERRAGRPDARPVGALS